MPHRKALIWMLIALAISAVWGHNIEASQVDGMVDFRAIYFGARAVLDGQNPYNPNDFLRVYQSEGGTIPPEPLQKQLFLRAVPICVNLPTTLFVVAPLALLGWGPAHLIWMALMPAGLLLSTWLIWNLAGGSAPKVTLFLLCMLLANSEVVLQLGNASGLAVCLGVAAVWCFVKRRHELAGVLCLALALALKPQEIGFIWLYFLLAGGVQRRRAVQSVALVIVMAIVSIVWVSTVTPHWMQDWHSNVAATTGHGDLNDPGPTSVGNDCAGKIVSLQAVISCFRDDPNVYNPLTFLICGTLILLWGLAVLRSRGSQERGSPEGMWLAIASITALGLLPVYHRTYDCKLLFLIIPAVAALRPTMSTAAWRWTVAVTTTTIMFCADIPVGSLILLQRAMHVRADHLGGQLVTVVLGRTPPLGLLLCGGFYLWMFARYAWSGVPARERDIGTDGQIGTLATAPELRTS